MYRLFPAMAQPLVKGTAAAAAVASAAATSAVAAAAAGPLLLVAPALRAAPAAFTAFAQITRSLSGSYRSNDGRDNERGRGFDPAQGLKEGAQGVASAIRGGSRGAGEGVAAGVEGAGDVLKSAAELARDTTAAVGTFAADVVNRAGETLMKAAAPEAYAQGLHTQRQDEEAERNKAHAAPPPQCEPMAAGTPEVNELPSGRTEIVCDPEGECMKTNIPTSPLDEQPTGFSQPGSIPTQGK